MFEIVNVKAIEARFEDGAAVNPESLTAAGLIRSAKIPVKILGTGDLAKKLEVTAAAFTKTAMEKITNAGGTATVI